MIIIYRSYAVARLRRNAAGIGIDARTGACGNMMKKGIIDSAKVVRIALQSAASLSAVLLTTDAGVVNK